MENHRGNCEHCGNPIFGDVAMVSGVTKMHPDCAEAWKIEYATYLDNLPQPKDK